MSARPFLPLTARLSSRYGTGRPVTSSPSIAVRSDASQLPPALLRDNTTRALVCMRTATFSVPAELENQADRSGVAMYPAGVGISVAVQFRKLAEVRS